MPSTSSDTDLRNLAAAAEKAREWTARRDNAVRAALAAGVSLRAVASACGMAHNAIVRIRDRG